MLNQCEISVEHYWSGKVVSGRPRRLLPLGIEQTLVALFARMSLSLRIIMTKETPTSR